MKITKLTKEKIEKIFGPLNGWWENVCMTALGAVALEILFKDSKDEWSLLRNKSLLYVMFAEFLILFNLTVIKVDEARVGTKWVK